MKGVTVLRPEPGAARTAARAAALGLDVLRLPLFEYRPLAWEMPDPAAFGALLLTSAAAPRLAGGKLAMLAHLPVVAVGPETAAAARAAGLAVALTGRKDAASVLAEARARGVDRLLHLAGRDRRPDAPGVTPIAVYASEPLEPDVSALAGRVALLHSARAAARLAELIGRDRAAIMLAALSPAVLAAAGPAWAAAAAAYAPNDAALLALAARLARAD